MDAEAVLVAACRQVGLDAADAELIRAGENFLYRLPQSVVARVTRPGQVDAARKEVRVSRWLIAQGIPAVEALANVEQPVEVGDRAVTFWRELPEHRPGTLAELADLLRQIHALPVPDVDLPPVAPFVRLEARLVESTALPTADRQWLLERLAHLQEEYAELPQGRPWCAVHGDAWEGNVVVTDGGPVLLDLERFAYGPPEWDLALSAVDYTTFGILAAAQWADFCARYGYDVTTWSGFDLLRDIRELRKVTFAWQLAAGRSDIAEQAAYRLACIRGERGPRPWGWTEVP
jgi:Ser/Thr protein kinase RdoA (MazF antagonist)